MEQTSRRKLKDYNPGNCPVVYSLNKIGNRWKLLIIHYIRQGHNRYSTLQRVIPDISRQTLTNQLRELEADGILDRVIYQQIPPRVEYNLTEVGHSLQPILREMSKWGLQYVTPAGYEPGKC
ncbi:MAG TPA: helix-turn-helix domain-containing protein [Saprospiraceae bacterium]|nr:helix-turn-helix transcriptional regulator [Saprospiraceae bacterium]MCC6689304.1 helix-turn-helix transcriptional regulator [Saprospiraceae bacterium]HMV25105.1 helix-turn-helix domain-containing protein [Saprospiraceae bacterium]HMW74406.1 helix-turn-helix domain-containing protein [Saprospiraceae bacterium]HMX82639.1 helix-turn-helix domain-containing protein [Saprospiraceae bacterium]